MKKVLVLIQGLNGCSLHRLILPYKEMERILKPEDGIELRVGLGNVKDEDELVEKILEFDVLVFHNSLPGSVLDRVKGKIVTVCDIDDSLQLPQSHPLYQTYVIANIVKILEYAIKNSDYITTTTFELAKELRKLNPNVIVFPNGLIPEGQFAPVDRNNKRVNIAVICGSSHVEDMKLLEGVVKNMPQELLDKVCFCLKGFDTGETKDAEGNSYPLPWSENPWVYWEKMLTNNYATITNRHREFLERYIKDFIYSFDSAYKRYWTLPIDKYAHHYDDVDILLVPLRRSQFNSRKSELKFIEASVKNTAVIASDVLPYSGCGINALDKGKVNPEGNCILVDERKGFTGWIKAIKKMVEDESFRKMTVENLKKLTEPGARFNLTDLAYKRLEFLKKI